MRSFFTYLKTHYISSFLAVVILIILGTIGYFYLNSQPKFVTVPVVRQQIMQNVAVTGTVKPSSNVDLAFEKSGTVSKVYADVGAQVKAGDTIVALSSADLVADLDQTEAQLKKEQVKLTNLRSGNRPEDIAISQSQLDNAQATLDAANVSALNAISDSYSKADDAISYHTDKFFNNPRTSAPTLLFSLNDSNLINSLQTARIEIGQNLTDFATINQKLTATSDVSAALNQTIVRLNKIKSFLDNLATGVNTLTTNSSLTQSTIDGYKSDMSLARADISTAISEVTNALNARDNALSVLQTAQSQLALQKAGSTQADIDAQVAQVQTEQGLVEIKQAALAKNYLKSPIDGVVSKQDAKVGEIAPAGVVLVSVISNSEFQIEANIPEANISKIHVGDATKVTLDAYQDGSVFDASVIKIDPAETIVDGVPTYKVTFQFAKVDARIKSGMTANVGITTALNPAALVVPQRVVFNDTQGDFVRVLRGGTSVVIRIQTGIKGSDGNVEILQGLKIGDQVITNSQ